FQANELPTQAFGKSGAGAEQHRHEVDAHLINASSEEELRADAGAEDIHVLVARRTNGGIQGLVGAANKGVDAALRYVVRSGVRDDERRRPALEAGAVGTPGRDRAIVRAASGEAGADRVLTLLEDVATVVVGAERPFV